MKYRVEFDRESCIGAGACVAANADYWSLENNKAVLKCAVYDAERKVWILEIDEKDLQRHKDAAEVCPVNAIHIYDEHDEKII